jgi:ribosome recycling factor
MPTGSFDINELKRRMQGATQSLKHELGGLRTGRAAASMLEPVQVDAYGTHMPLNQLATISVPEPRLLSVQVWDKSMVKAVEKAIVDSNLGLSPATEGQVLRLRIPELNEDRRKELVKVAHKYAEAAKVAVRHVRRDGLDTIKKLEKNHEISEDDQERLANDVQKATDGRSRRSISCLRPRKRKSSPSSYLLSEHVRERTKAFVNRFPGSGSCSLGLIDVERRRPCNRRTGSNRRSVACGDHHGRQRALGGGPRSAARRRPSPRRRGVAPRRSRRQ